MMQRPLCLASQSPYRKQLLERLDLVFSQQKPAVDESALKADRPDLSPRELCLFLGKAKGESVHKIRKTPQQITLSGDQLVHFQDQILGKTEDPQDAFRQLRALSGQTHFLLTSFFVFANDEVHEIFNSTAMKMRDLSDEEIHRYLELDQPFDCAGTYKIEQHGISLFSEIITEDFTAIQGIPLMALNQKLFELKVREGK